MKYKVLFKGGANGATEEERVVTAHDIQIGNSMTMLTTGSGVNKYAVLVIPNDRVIYIEKIG